MVRYQYKPLGADEIRIIGFDEENLDGIKIQHIRRPSDESTTSEVSSAYHALSYAWGSGSKSCLIFIDGADFTISTDLQQALHHIRSDQSLLVNHLPTLLWVDAICIDQENSEEKVTQVLHMKETYEGACKVIVWLGGEPELREATGRAASFLCNRIPLTSNGHVPVLERPDYFRHPDNAPILRIIGQDVLRRPWWWRMWVIQEVAVAKSITVICNGHHFSWERLLYTAQWISLFEMDVMNAPEELAEENPFFPNITFKSMYRWKLQQGEPIPILELLENASSCLASNPRDMIFSVLGLASDIEALPTVNNEYRLVCNYERSIKEVYVDFAKVHIHTHNSLDVITFSRNYTGRKALPSWVPDWSDLRKGSCFSLGKRPSHSAARLAVSNPYTYDASWGRPPVFEFLQDDTLRVSGIRVDTVIQVSEPYFDPTPPGEKFDRTIRDWETIALGEDDERAPDTYMGTTQNLLEAFDHTITADMNIIGERVQRHEMFVFLNNLVRVIPEGVLNAEIVDDIMARWNKARRAVYLRIQRRLFFTTSAGYFGLGPWDTKAEDIVFVLLGCNVPVLLRQEGDRWVFVGEGFVMGIMDGEMVQAAERDVAGDSEGIEHGSGRRVESVVIS